MRVLQLPDLEDLLNDKATPYPYNKSFEEAYNDPLVSLHTSGSTGRGWTIWMCLWKNQLRSSRFTEAKEVHYGICYSHRQQLSQTFSCQGCSNGRGPLSQRFSLERCTVFPCKFSFAVNYRVSSTVYARQITKFARSLKSTPERSRATQNSNPSWLGLAILIDLTFTHFVKWLQSLTDWIRTGRSDSCQRGQRYICPAKGCSGTPWTSFKCGGCYCTDQVDRCYSRSSCAIHAGWDW